MTSPDWPELPFREWESTCDTVHMWTQIVGKTRLELASPENHWWHAALYVTPRGLTTSPIPYGPGTFDVEFDFLAHKLSIRSSAGEEETIDLYARSVADFYAEYMARLRSLEIEVSIRKTPSEFDDTTPFDEDNHHASYDEEYVDRFRRILIRCDRIFKEFKSGYQGKASPVHFFWGSFDLAYARFSGRPAPLKPGMDSITKEAYSHEEASCGFWPGDRRFPDPAFYAYTVPAPEGIDQAPRWHAQLGEFILKYDDARQAAEPDQTVLDFCQSSYEAGAHLGKWDHASLERKD